MGKDRLDPLTVKHCQMPSDEYLRLLEEAGDDPRSAAGYLAMDDLERHGGWMPAIDSRDASIPATLGRGEKKS